MKKKYIYNEKKLIFEQEKYNIIKNVIIYFSLLLLGIFIGILVMKKETNNIKINYFNLKSKEEFYTIGSKEWRDSTFKMYEKRAEIYLKNIKTPIKPGMLSLAAYNVYDSLGILVPLELVLAQATLESSMGNEGRSPINNPFNVGEYDSKTVLWFDNTFSGIQAYYFLIAKNYLKCKNLNTLLKDFTNCIGNRYAKNPKYEIKLNKIIKTIKRKINKGLIEKEINKI